MKEQNAITIRNTTSDDLKKIYAIYERARAYMKRTGNPNQWKDDRPRKEVILRDVKNHNSYVIEDEGEIIAVFSYIVGKDSTYEVIKDGAWLNDETYGTIHMIASAGIRKNIFPMCLSFCESLCSNIRIDTHKENQIMRHLLEKNGFVRCGLIYVDDGSERIAYQRV